MVGSRYRRGGIALNFLVILPLVLLVLLMVMMLAHLEQARSDAQIAVDAAARGAALTLVDDASLLEDSTLISTRMVNVLKAARIQASLLALDNTILGTGTTLEFNADLVNSPGDDVLFGIAKMPQDEPDLADVTNPDDLRLINAVQVNLIRSDERENPIRLIGGGLFGGRYRQMARSATAILDHGVIGFRSVLGQPIPFVPIALLSHPTDNDSWENQVEMGSERTDEFRYTKNPYLVMNDSGDGLAEMTVYLLNRKRTGTDNSRTNAAILMLGNPSLAEFAQQVATGIKDGDLVGLPNGLVLDPATGKLIVDGTEESPNPSNTDYQALVNAFLEMKTTGAVRAWPLYEPSVPADPDTPSKIVINRFVAARIMEVQQVEIQIPGIPPGVVLPPQVPIPPGLVAKGLRLVIQPTAMHYIGSVLAPDTADPRPYNRYLSKVRLALPR